MAAEEHLGPQFHVEDDTLHVGGRPFRMAVPVTESTSQGFRTWKIPFESGHEMVVGGAFDDRGEVRSVLGGSTGPGLLGTVHHVGKPKSLPWRGTEKAPLGGDLWENPEGGTSNDRTFAHMPTAEVFHRRLREVSELEGGGRASRSQDA